MKRTHKIVLCWNRKPKGRCSASFPWRRWVSWTSVWKFKVSGYFASLEFLLESLWCLEGFSSPAHTLWSRSDESTSLPPFYFSGQSASEHEYLLIDRGCQSNILNREIKPPDKNRIDSIFCGLSGDFPRAERNQWGYPAVSPHGIPRGGLSAALQSVQSPKFPPKPLDRRIDAVGQTTVCPESESVSGQTKSGQGSFAIPLSPR